MRERESKGEMVTLHSTHGLEAIETLTASKPGLHCQSPADTHAKQKLKMCQYHNSSSTSSCGRECSSVCLSTFLHYAEICQMDFWVPTHRRTLRLVRLAIFSASIIPKVFMVLLFLLLSTVALHTYRIIIPFGRGSQSSR